MASSVFIDICKTFDTGNNDPLCKQLERYGIQQWALCWFQSYLCKRKQHCRVAGGGELILYLEEKLELEILGSEPDLVTKTRYLGVQTDNGLDRKEHIRAITSKVSRAIGCL